MTEQWSDDEQQSRLWYTRRDGEVRGPFPLTVIQNHILLGRLQDSDELSDDGQHWRTLAHHPELVPEVLKNVRTPEDEAALKLARLRADERRGHDRRGDEAPVSGERRRVERRRPESLDAVQHRLLAEEVNAARRRDSLARLGALPTLLILLVALILVGLFFWLSPPAPDEVVADCSMPAAPGVNWSYCHKEAVRLTGADLSGAVLANARLTAADLGEARLTGSDLRYANLSGARLDAARLSGADLTGAVLISTSLVGADLRDADLSFANLEGADLRRADLSGARLHKTIWVDGRLCPPGSVGSCQRAATP